MKKSVYSIVLSDEVVEAVDRLAYSMNTSRSNLINRILAERVSLMTPEMRMRDIFSKIEQLMDSRFQLAVQPSETMLSIKSPLKYKYKPTIRYSVELFRSFEGGVGRLRVSLRTQSGGLIRAIQGFFRLWEELESKYLQELFTEGVPWEAGDCAFSRDFYAPRSSRLSDEEIAQAIGSYINLIDECIRIYFENIDALENASEQIEELYRRYLKKGVIIL